MTDPKAISQIFDELTGFGWYTKNNGDHFIIKNETNLTVRIDNIVGLNYFLQGLRCWHLTMTHMEKRRLNGDFSLHCNQYENIEHLESKLT